MAQLFCSIIVPTYARPTQLAACLQALAALDYPRDRFEVLVVDDGSPTPSDSLVDSFRTEIDVTLLVQPNQGPAAARNTGAARARGDVIAFTDDDCAPQPDWLTTLVTRYVASPTALIGGQTRNALDENLYATASQLLVSYLYDYYNAKPTPRRFFTSNNMALATAQFRDIGGFDVAYARAAAEDRDFCDRWQRRGYAMVYAPEAVVYHAHALNLRSFWRQHANYGRGAYRFHRMYGQRATDSIAIEPAAFYFNLLRYPFTAAPPRRALLLMLLVAAQAANAVGYCWERVRSSEQKHRVQ